MIQRYEKVFFVHLAEMAGRENNERSIEIVVLSHSLTFEESSTSSHAVDKFRLRPDFELFFWQTKVWPNQPSKVPFRIR